MKKTISLIMAILLSLTIFASDITGIVMIARADDEVYSDDYSDPGDDDEVDIPDFPDYPDPSQQDPSMPDPGSWGDDDYNEKYREREEAYEKAAREAEEAAKKAQEDAAAQAAAQAAAEAEAKAKAEAEMAEKIAEEKKKLEEQSEYSLVANVGSINFGSAMQGQQRDYVPILITNVGNSDVDLICAKSGDADGAFSLSLHGDNTHLEPGDTTAFNVSMASDLGVGTYTASAKFADSTRDPGYKKALSIPISGVVTPRKEVVTAVVVTPSKASLAVGGGAQFSAEVYGNTDRIYTVRWTVIGNRSTGTTISDDGFLNVADDETASTINVVATCREDTSVSGTAVVNLKKNCYNVIAKANPSNGGAVTGGGAVPEGGSVTLSAVPGKNFYFVGWILDGTTVSTATNYTVSDVRSNMTFTAKFSQRSVNVRVVPNNPNAGAVIGGGTIEYGGNTTISAKAYNGYVFIGWKEDDSFLSTDASMRLTNVTYDRKITAIFEQTRHTLTLAADPKEGGTVSGGGTFDYNQGTTVKAQPANGYTFQGWQVNGQYVSRDKEFRIDRVSRDCTCTAIFTKNSVTLYEMSSGVATTGGSISPSGKLVVAAGQNLTYTITPKSGFAILAVAVDGSQVGPVSTYTFSNIQGNHQIAAAFVQTDAGKQAAQESGKPVQEEKVKPIPKTTLNTATTDSTVKIEDAADGEGGDDYVEEMNLSEVNIPTDEQLGIKPEEAEPDNDSPVVKMLGTSMDEVSRMVSEGDTMPVLDAAFFTGGLDAYIYNAFEPQNMQTIDYHKLTTEELMSLSNADVTPTLPDVDYSIQKMLTTDEVMKLARGEHIDISISLTGTDKVDDASKKIMSTAVGRKPVKYFDLTMLKTEDGYTERITEMPRPMEVIIEVPQDIYKEGKTYSILRVHDGELSVLPDLDDDPRTITFKTDRFSNYAIAQNVTSANSIIAWLVGGAALALGVALTCLLILVAHQRKVRKMKRAAAVQNRHKM